MTRLSHQGYSDAQLDGLACIGCGEQFGAMVPAGVGPRGQLFRHESCTGDGMSDIEGWLKHPAIDALAISIGRHARYGTAHILRDLHAQGFEVVPSTTTEGAVEAARPLVRALELLADVRYPDDEHLPSVVIAREALAQYRAAEGGSDG